MPQLSPLTEKSFNNAILFLENYMDVTLDLNVIRSRSRKQENVFIRALVANFMRGEGVTVEEIGKSICRDHSDVTHLLNNYPSGKYTYNPDLFMTLIRKMNGFNSISRLDELIKHHAGRVEHYTKMRAEAIAQQMQDKTYAA